MLKKLFKLFSILFIFIIFVGGIYGAVSTTGLVAYYNFETDSTDSVGSVDGTDYNTPTYINGSSCLNGGCVDFESTNTEYIRFGDNFDMGSSDFSFTWWSDVEDDVYGFFFNKGDHTTGTGGVVNSAHVSHNSVRAGTYSSVTDWDYVTETSGDYTGLAMYTVRRSGNDLYFYINATEIGSVGIGGASISNSFDFQIGSRYTGGTYADKPFDGTIDEFAYFSRALSTAEITELYDDKLIYNGVSFISSLANTPQIQTNITNGSYYSSSSLNISVNTTSNVNMSYSLNGGSFVSIANEVNQTSFILSGLSEVENNLSLRSIDISGTNFNNLSFFVDTTFPLVNTTASPYNTNTYLINWSEVIIYSDLNLDTCIISLGTTNINCTNESYNSPINGNISFNVSVTDLAGNINSSYNNTLFIDPLVIVNFVDDNSTSVTNFSINNINYTNYFNTTIYTLGLGLHYFNFSKTGFSDFTFSLNFSNTSDINVTFSATTPYINIFIKEITNNSLTTPKNYTILYYNINDDLTQTYYIVNNNTYSIANIYSINTSIEINLIDSEGRILTNKRIVPPRNDINVTFYVASNHNLSLRSVRALNPSLIPIVGGDIDFYVYLETTGEFVLTNTIETDGLGISYNYIVPGNFFYNVCNTYSGVQKCLNQIIFEPSSIQTPDYDLIHASTLTGEVRQILNYINWSYSEVKTNTTSQLSFYFNDAQQNSNQFCLNATRTTGATIEELGIVCSSSPSGALVQTFGLTSGQYLDYTLSFDYDSQTYVLYKYRSYGANADITGLNLTDLVDILFLILFLGLMGYMIMANDFDLYVFGVYGFLLLTLSIQSFLNQDYAEVTLWGIMASKSALIYFVRND